MRAMRLLVLPALVLGGVACGSDGGNSSAAWCDLAENVQEASDDFDALEPTDPEAVEQVFEDFRDQLDEAVDAAPDEIKDAVETASEGINELYDMLRDVDFNFLELDTEQLEELTRFGEEQEEAANEIETYNEEECGIEPSDSGGSEDETVTTDGSTDEETVTSDLPGADGSVPGIPGMAEIFADLGLDDDQAACLAENSTALSEMDPENPMEMFDILEECGISMEELINIGEGSDG